MCQALDEDKIFALMELILMRETDNKQINSEYKKKRFPVEKAKSQEREKKDIFLLQKRA